MNIKKIFALLVVAGLVPASLMARPVRFRLEFAPLGGIYSPDAQLSISKTTGWNSQRYYIEDGAGAYFGSLQLGIEIDTKIGYLDILGGGGLLLLPAAEADSIPVGGAVLLDIGYRFKLNRRGTITLGPFLGVIIPTDSQLKLDDDFSTTSYNDVDTFDLEASGGIQGGLKFTVGGKYVNFLMKVGYAQLEYEVEPVDDPGWKISYGTEDALVMSGPFLQLGLSAQF